MIYEYGVVSDRDLDLLVKEVNKEISGGWKPLGGISSLAWQERDFKHGDAFYWVLEFHQAMVRIGE